MKMIKEFKEFAIKGNAVDLAVGVVIGAAFGSVVNSIVKDLINPILGLLTGNIDFSEKALILKQATETTEAITLNWGNFVSAVISFLVISIAIFMVVKQMNNLNRKEEVKEIKKGPTEKDILIEIRDELRK
jgi:large conductance mechanosensitive channel